MSAVIRRLSALALAASLLVSLSACEKKETYQAPPPPEVTVSKPETRRVALFATYTGNTVAYNSVDIKARVEGFLDKINFTPSSRVKAGDLLFVIEQAPYQAKVDQAKADLATSKAKLQLAEATLIRKESAYKDRAVSEVDVIQAKADTAQAAAGVKAAEAALESANIDYKYTSIHTPIEGRVSRNLVDAGNLVGAGEATLLTTVVDDDPLYAYFNISEADLLKFTMAAEKKHAQGNLEKDRPVINMGPGLATDFPFKGEIDYIDNTVDPGTGTIQLRGVFPNPDGKLLPGMFVRVQVPVGILEKALLVPDAAIGADQGGRYLLTVGADNVVKYNKVTLGPLEGKDRVILEGITADDVVVVNGLQRARPGAKVTPKQAGPEAKAANGQKCPPAQGQDAKKASDQSKDNPAEQGADKPKPQTQGG